MEFMGLTILRLHKRVLVFHRVGCKCSPLYYHEVMNRRLIWTLCFPLAIVAVVVLSMTTSVSRPSPAEEEDLAQKPCVPTQADQPFSAGGVEGRAELRTPEDMERAERENPVPIPPGGIPFMPTEESYWSEKAAADAMRDTGQSKASVLEAEKAERDKLSDPCQGSR